MLGLSAAPLSDEVKAAFRRLAQRYHPDKNQGDERAQEKFKEINAAYQVLSDPTKRQMFDRFGAAGVGAGAGGAGVGGFDFSDLGNLNMDGIFGDLLRGFGVRSPAGDTGELKKEIVISFEEAAFGVEKELTYERTEACGDCRGSGSEPGQPRETCSACMGRGRVRFQQGLFPVAIDRTCSRCHGAGKLVVHPCKACRGAGLLAVARTITVSIPAGIEDRSTRTVERGGNLSREGQAAGNLELISGGSAAPILQADGRRRGVYGPRFVRAGRAGRRTRGPHHRGEGEAEIPAGTQPGSLLRIKGKGIPRRSRSGRGDQLVELTVEVPTALTPRQRDLLEALAKELGSEVQPQQKGFVQKLKEFFD